MNNTSSPSDQLLSGLRHTAPQLAVVRDFYAGHHTDDILLPNNVLMFHQHDLSAQTDGAAHHRFMLIVPIQTAGQIIVDQMVLNLLPGQVLLVQPWQFHRYANFHAPTLSWLFVTFELPNHSSLVVLRDTLIVLDQTISDQIEHLCADYLRLTPSHANHVNAVRLRLGLILNALIHKQQACSQVETGDESPTSLISQAGQFVFAHMDEPIPVTDVADHLAISVGHLRNRFRRDYRISVSHYIRQIKMMHAMRLLCTTDLSVTQIADRCGYHSLFAFSRAFKHETNQSPRACRTERKVVGLERSGKTKR